MVRSARLLLGMTYAAGFWACVGEDVVPLPPSNDAGADAAPVDGGGGGSAEAGLDGGAVESGAGPEGGIEAGGEAGAGVARIFATSKKYNGGAFGGLTGADAICAGAAITKGLPGQYRAWLSNDATDAISRIQGNGPWRRVGDDAIVFQNRAALSGVPLVGVTFDETGASIAGNANVWTGTKVGGTHTADTCSNWSSNEGSAKGTYGLGDRSDSGWTDLGGEPCNDFVRLLCLRAD